MKLNPGNSSVMKKYSADIGSWDSGQYIPFKAKTDENAIKRAVKILKEYQKKDKKAYIVQIRECTISETCGRVFYDYMNGHMKGAI
jgi:hypothetical protein